MAIVYRIAKTEARARDLSGKGAFQYGGRWNSAGTFMLYTSEHASLAILEVLVHADESEIPPRMFIAQIDIGDQAIFSMPDEELPKNWREPDNLRLKEMGDRLMAEKEYLGFRVRSAVLPEEYNVILNPLFPGFYDLVKVVRVEELGLDGRLL